MNEHSIMRRKIGMMCAPRGQETVKAANTANFSQTKVSIKENIKLNSRGQGFWNNGGCVCGLVHVNNQHAGILAVKFTSL